MEIKSGVRRTHVSLVLAKLTLDKLCAALQEDAGKERTVHLDFSPGSAEEGFFTLPFTDVLKAMAHFGARTDQGGAVNIDGLHVTADLSGLKIKDPDELPQLHNLALRSTIKSFTLDLSHIIEPSHQKEAWGRLAALVDDPNTKHLETLNLIDGHCTDEAKARLTNAAKARQNRGQAITVIVNGEQLAPPGQE
jgi:hypothetical protein